MRELESSLQQFAEFLLETGFVRETAAPSCVRHVRRFLARPATDGTLGDRVREFCEQLEREGSQDWQIRQTEHAIRLYFVHFLKRTDWHDTPASQAIDAGGQVTPASALEQMRLRLRARHYALRTEDSYTHWAHRFLTYLAEQQSQARPRVDAQAVRDFATHLVTRLHVSASTQNQAVSAMLFLCRKVLSLKVDGLQLAVRARRGTHLPVVLSLPETAALLDAMRGTARLMATLIYGGGLRLSECCTLHVKDLDDASRSFAWFWVFPSHTLSTDPRAGIVRRHHLHETGGAESRQGTASTSDRFRSISATATVFYVARGILESANLSLRSRYAARMSA